MQEESVLVLNDIEKRIAEGVIHELSSMNFPVKCGHSKHSMSYDYYSDKNEKIVHGVVLGCKYKLRYKDSNRIFFSAWNCKDVCGIFYDVIGVIFFLCKLTNIQIGKFSWPFNVDLNTERYVFFARDAAAWFVSALDYIAKQPRKVLYSSQYVLSVFDESDQCLYDELIQKIKSEGYSKIRILQIWIRGEILYYAIVDGAVLRPEHQRFLTSTEEEDLSRKMYKSINNKFHPVDLTALA